MLPGPSPRPPLRRSGVPAERLSPAPSPPDSTAGRCHRAGCAAVGHASLLEPLPLGAPQWAGGRAPESVLLGEPVGEPSEGVFERAVARDEDRIGPRPGWAGLEGAPARSRRPRGKQDELVVPDAVAVPSTALTEILRGPPRAAFDQATSSA